MSRIAFYGDRHISQRNSRFQHALDIWDWAIDDALNAGATIHVGCGDVVEGWPTEEEFYQVARRYANLLGEGCSVLEALGNHESPLALRPLELLGVRVAYDELVLAAPEADVRILLIPYPRRGRAPFDSLKDDGTITGSMRAAADLIRTTIQDAGAKAKLIGITDQGIARTPLIVAGHWTIAGMKTGEGDYELHSAHEVIVPVDAFDGVALAVTGHIHKAQDIAPNVVGAGSLYRTTFDEATDPKSYILATVEGHDVRWERRPVPAREMIVVNVDLAPGGEIVVDDALVTSAVGKEVKVSARVHEEMLRAYDPDVFAPLRAAAAFFQLNREVIPTQRVRAPELQRPKPVVNADGTAAPEPPPLSLFDYVRAWLNATNQPLSPDRLERLSAKVATLTV